MPLHRNYNNFGREQIRGEGETIVDIIADAYTPQEWLELLDTLLERAAARGNRGLVHKLLERRPKGVGMDMGVVLLIAVRGGHAELLDDLMKTRGAAVRSLDRHGNGPLHVACQADKPELIKTLMDNGVDKSSKNSGGCTPMYVASQHGHVACGQILVDAGVDVSDDCGFQRTALHIAAGRGHVDFLRLLFKYGADVNQRDGFKRTAVHHAAGNCHIETIELLLEKGADINPADSTGRTPLHDVSARLYRDTILVLLKHGADVNQTDSVGTTALQFAALKAGKSGCAEVVEILLRAGADESIADYDDETAIDVAGEYVDEEDRVTWDYDRVRSLLKSAPADRAWRRRGYMVLCRSHPDRLQLPQDNSQTEASTTEVTCSNSDEPAEAEGGSQGAPPEGSQIIEPPEDSESKLPDASQSERPDASQDAPPDASQSGPPDVNPSAPSEGCQGAPPDGSQSEPPDASQGGSADVSQDAPTEGDQSGPSDGSQGSPPEGGQGDSAEHNTPVDEKAGWKWTSVTARVLGMQEEGLFRTIVGYL